MRNPERVPSMKFRAISHLIHVAAVLLAVSVLAISAGAQNPSQNVIPDAKATKTPFGELSVSPGSLSFNKISLSSSITAETKTFAVVNAGTGPVHASVSSSTNPDVFIVAAGGTTVLLAPKAKATFSVEFAPPSAGQYAGSFSVNTSSGDVTKGKTSITVKMSGSAKGSPKPTPGNVNLSGTVESGAASVCNSKVALYAAGESGAGAAAYGAGASLVTNAASNAAGKFTLNFNCPSADAQMYAVALGGVAKSCSGSNSALGLIAALGPCGKLPSSIVINEVTTVASVWALQKFMDASGQTVGTSSANSTGLANAMISVTSKNLIDVTIGAAPSTFGAGVTSPTNVMNTLADILFTCASTAKANSSQCSSLLGKAKPAGKTQPANTLQAALDIALNPANNVSALFGLAPSSPPFRPDLSSAPGSWVLAINYASVATQGEALDLALDGAGNIWVPDAANKAVYDFAPDSGYALAASYPTVMEDFPVEVIVDSAGNVWTADHHQLTEFPAGHYNSPVGHGCNDGNAPLDWDGTFNYNPLAFDTAGNIWLENSSGSLVCSGSFTGALQLLGPNYTGENDYTNSAANFTSPSELAIDPSNNVWVLNHGSTPALSELVAPNYSSGGNTFPITGGMAVHDLAIDALGNVFMTNDNPNTSPPSQGSVIERIASNGNFTSLAPSGANLANAGPTAIAIDAASNLWVIDNAAGGVSELSAASSYQTGFFYNPAAANMVNPNGATVDESGNLWVIVNPRPYSESQLIGVAAPTLTPAQACLIQESATKAGCVP